MTDWYNIILLSSVFECWFYKGHWHHHDIMSLFAYCSAVWFVVTCLHKQNRDNDKNTAGVIRVSKYELIDGYWLS